MQAGTIAEVRGPVAFRTHDFNALVQKIKSDCAYKMGDLKSMVLLNEPDKKVVLTGLHSQTEIESVNNNQNVTVFMVEGAIKLTIKKESTVLFTGQKFAFSSNCNYKIESLSEAFYVLTLSQR